VLRQAAPAHRIKVLEARLEHPDGHGQNRQQRELLARLAYPQLRQERLLLADDDVDRDTDEHLRQDVEEPARDREAARQRDVATIRARVSEQAANRMRPEP